MTVKDFNNMGKKPQKKKPKPPVSYDSSRGISYDYSAYDYRLAANPAAPPVEDSVLTPFFNYQNCGIPGRR